MEISTIGIPLAFLIISSIGLWIIVYTSGSWLFKMAFIVMCLYFSLVMWHSLGDLSGWPTSSNIPQKTIVHWILVQEPSKTNKSEQGFIFLWATEVDINFGVSKKATFGILRPFSSRKSDSEPRAYRLPYSELAHQQAVEAMKIIMSGKTLVGESTGNEPSTNHGKDRNTKSGQQESLSMEQIFRFYELPPSKLPEKITGK